MKSSLARHSVTIACGSGFLLFGYDQGVFGGLLSNKPFLETFNNPSSTIQGQIVATYDIGCIMGTVVSMIFGDKLGRRKSILIGCVVLIVDGILQAASYSLAPMIAGRIVAGVGNGMNTIAIPIWQAETAAAHNRGKLIVLQLVTNIFGIVITNWMNYGFTYIPDSPISWRFPLAFQCFFAIVTIALVFVSPESPRWLVMTNRITQAKATLVLLLNKPIDDPAVIQEIQQLEVSVTHENEVQSSVTLKEIFGGGQQMTFRRILLGAGTPFFQQMGGVNVIAYYLPVVLVRSFGMTDRMALILSACDNMQLMFWGGLAALLIDRVGRRRLMMFGVTASILCFVVVAVGLRYGGPGSNNTSMSILAVAFIFMYYVFYGLSLLSIPYMYPAEINSQRMRNTGTSIATAVNWIFVYVVVVITPTAIDSIGWKYYLVYAITNICFLPIIWRCIKHEGGRSISWKEARRLALMTRPALEDIKVQKALTDHVEITEDNQKGNH
ncbi:hypothetical protein CFIO01_13262 [Colletotrichum fioriniae PJ7]|uniref:Major facilitator superfamily (MFS) profile domain-containing protein n=1 Tax=Colletotrichum fioriniae PJ7 TaxID=1445577 RepID=A0A010R3W4_9PEZI|nr:hypothetical protein CFIO01_13262 [Colletotrichum fioriniae PJ7]